MSPLTTRRNVIGAISSAVAISTAGCIDTELSLKQNERPSRTTDGTALDLREANVTDVMVGQRDDQAFRFSVTLYHDDDGESGYADWWQVETLDGHRLGRRELAHPHGTRKFIRSAVVEVPANVTCVVVRGHDQTHGYGGQAMLVNVETGKTTAKQQGTEKASFTESDCP